MVKLRLGKEFEITGDATEIKDLLTNIGLDKKEILKLSTKPKVAMGWFVVPFILYFIITCLLYTDTVDANVRKIVELSNFFIIFWAAIVTHLKYKKWIVTSLVGTGGVIISLVALHSLTPIEATKKMEDKFGKAGLMGAKQDTSRSNDSSKTNNDTKPKSASKPKRVAKPKKKS